MRPVNLIPKDERVGARRPMRGGPLAYIVLGSLLAALAAVTLLVLTNNQISDSKAEIETLNVEISAAEAQAAESAAYVQFHQLAEQRGTTVTNLANSRFDWERVMRQLSLVVPEDVWLTNLTASVKPGVSPGGEASGLRDSVAGPALQVSGCAEGQEAVARFVSALKEIEGVTRIGVQASQIGGEGGGETGSTSASGSCEAGEFVAQFQLVVAFDAAPIPVVGSETAATEVVAAPPAEGESAEGAETAAAETEGG
jgi:Tfp pilus assembly protein PilN